MWCVCTCVTHVVCVYMCDTCGVCVCVFVCVHVHLYSPFLGSECGLVVCVAKLSSGMWYVLNVTTDLSHDVDQSHDVWRQLIELLITIPSLPFPAGAFP